MAERDELPPVSPGTAPSARWPREVFDAVVDILATILVEDLRRREHHPVDTADAPEEHGAPGDRPPVNGCPVDPTRRSRQADTGRLR